MRGEVGAALSEDLATKVDLEDSISGILILLKEGMPQEFKRKVLFSLNRFGATFSGDREGKNVLVPWRKMAYRTVLRRLKDLTREKRVHRIGKGHYTIDAAIQKRENLASAYSEVLSFNAAGLRGHYATTLLGKDGIVIPFNSAHALPQTTAIFKKIYDWRLNGHKDKETAKAEANIWINSFMNTVRVEIGTTGVPFKIISGRMMTSERQEIGPAVLGAIVGKRVSKRKFGVDALVFQSATEIMFRLLTSLIDLESLKAFGDSDIVVKVSFNPLEFLRSMNNLKEPFESRLNRQMVRKWGVLPSKTYLEPETRKKRVFSEGSL